MLSTLGYASVIAALLGAVITTLTGLIGGFKNRPVLIDASRRATYFTFVAMTAAIVTMEAALLTHDKVLRTAIENHEGFLFSHTGDGVVAPFTSVGAHASVSPRRREQDARDFAQNLISLSY